MKGYKLKGFGRNHVIPQESNKPKAIIVTFPVKFLIDLGYSILRRDYEYAYQKNTESRIRTYKKKEHSVRKAFAGNLFINTKENIIKMGYGECIRQIESVKFDPEGYWLHSMGNKPVDEQRVTHAYINILSKIRYKAKVIGFEPGGEQQFDDGRKRTAKHWLLLHEFEKLKPAIKMGGFQGFRYWKENY